MNPMMLSMIAVVIAGGATALQAPTNAKMMTAVGSPVNAAFVSFAVGTAALGLLAVILQAKPDMAAARNLPWYAWIGGLYGAVFVVAAAWGVPRLGAFGASCSHALALPVDRRPVRRNWPRSMR